VERPLAAAALVAALAALAPSPARADLALGPETHVPWSLGGRLEWRPIDLIRPSVSVGYLPQAYVDGVGRFIEDPDVRDLVTHSIENSLVVAPRLTLNPVLGLTASFGARFYFLGGGADAGKALRAAIPELRNLPDLSDRRVEATARPRLLEAGLGWRFGLGPLELLVEGGWIWATGADVRVTNVSGVPRRIAENYLHDAILTYGQAPYLAVGLFFVL
jgi:hypothetical protein